MIAIDRNLVYLTASAPFLEDDAVGHEAADHGHGRADEAAAIVSEVQHDAPRDGKA